MSDEDRSPFAPRDDTPFESYEVFHACPNCDKAMDSAAKASGPDGGPEVGSLMICYYCGYPTMVEQTTDLSVSLRDLTRSELASVLSDPDVSRIWAIRAVGLASRN